MPHTAVFIDFYVGPPGSCGELVAAALDVAAGASSKLGGAHMQKVLAAMAACAGPYGRSYRQPGVPAHAQNLDARDALLQRGAVSFFSLLGNSRGRSAPLLPPPSLPLSVYLSLSHSLSHTHNFSRPAPTPRPPSLTKKKRKQKRKRKNNLPKRNATKKQQKNNKKQVHLAPSRVLVVPADVLLSSCLRGSFGLMVGAITLNLVNKAEMALMQAEFEEGNLPSTREVRDALVAAHGQSAFARPRLTQYLANLGLPPRPAGPGFDSFFQPAVTAFRLARGLTGPPPLTALTTSKALSGRSSHANSANHVYVPSMGVVNAQQLPRPHAGVVEVAGPPGTPPVPLPFMLVLLGLIAGDGAIPAGPGPGGLAGNVVLGTALFEGQMHALTALMLVGPSPTSDSWARVGARLIPNGGAATNAVPHGTVRSITYDMASTFSDAAAARELAHYLSAGHHGASFGSVHTGRLL